MGIHPNKNIFGKVPRYYITDTVEEDAGGGSVRIWNFTRKNGVLIPQFECIVNSTNCLLINRKIAAFAQTVFNSEALRVPGMKVH